VPPCRRMPGRCPGLHCHNHIGRAGECQERLGPAFNPQVAGRPCQVAKAWAWHRRHSCFRGGARRSAGELKRPVWLVFGGGSAIRQFLARIHVPSAGRARYTEREAIWKCWGRRGMAKRSLLILSLAILAGLAGLGVAAWWCVRYALLEAEEGWRRRSPARHARRAIGRVLLVKPTPTALRGAEQPRRRVRRRKCDVPAGAFPPPPRREG